MTKPWEDAAREAAEGSDWTYVDRRQQLRETWANTVAALNGETTEETDSADDTPTAD